MAAKKILIVDDEVEIRELIKKYLAREGFLTIEAGDADEAVLKYENEQPDLVVLDIMLGESDGFDVLKYIRKKDEAIPVIFVSAKDEDYDKILGLGLGGDDYVTKPFSPGELVARIKAHLRKSASKIIQSSGEIIKGGLRLDTDSCTLYVNGKEVELSGKEFKMLKFFMENQGKVFTKNQIYKNVWDDYFYDDNSVMVYIRKLREKIEEKPNEPQYIKTVWGLGYKFEAKAGGENEY